MEISGKIIEIIGQIIGFLFAYYLLRLAYKLYGKNRFPGAVLMALASVFILLCSLQWFQVWAKSFIASNVTAKLTAFGQQVDSVQETTTEMHNQLASSQADLDKLQNELAEVQGRIEATETNVATVQQTAVETRNQLAAHQVEIDKHQTALDGVQGRLGVVETNAFDQQSVISGQFQQMLAVQSGLAGVGTNLSAQEKRLSDMEHWIKLLYGSTTNGTSTNPGTNN